MRLIDADVLQKPLYAEDDNITGFGMTYDEMDGYNDGVDAAWSRIDNAPTVDTAPVVYGKWIKSDFLHIGANQYRCSECWEDEWWLYHFSLGDSNYCPNCGAKMDGGRE